MKAQFFKIFLLLLLAYFSFLLLKITLQYIPYHPDVAFLRIKQHFVDKPFYLVFFYIHVYTAIFSVLAGFTQFSKTLQNKYSKFHRYLGWFYVLVVLLFAAPSGLFIGIYANGGLSSQIAFVLLAVLWFVFTFIALRKAIKKNFKSHRYFMIRSFSLTLSAISLRAWKYLIVYCFHPKPMDVYIIVAWLGWVLNLLIAEVIIYRLKQKE